jgi:hypothetical protein
MRVPVLLLVAALGQFAILADSLPEPRLAYNGSQDNGSGFTQYKFAVSNFADYSDELFQPAPSLPPCGKNRNASRTWVEILDDHGRYLYGFCALSAAAEMQKLWFALPAGMPPPKSIRVVVKDRATDRAAEGRLDIPAAAAP